MTESPVNSGQNQPINPEQSFVAPNQDFTQSPQVETAPPEVETPSPIETPPIQPEAASAPAAPPVDFSPPTDDGMLQPEQSLIEWQAPSRPFKTRNRQYYTTIGIIVFLICLILFFAGQFLPIAVVIALAFLAYVLSAIPPEKVIHSITTYGIRSDNTLYTWDELGRFWFTEKFGQQILHFETNRFPGQISLVLTDLDTVALTDALSGLLVHEKPPMSGFDKAAQWLQDKVPLDTEA